MTEGTCYPGRSSLHGGRSAELLPAFPEARRAGVNDDRPSRLARCRDSERTPGPSQVRAQGAWEGARAVLKRDRARQVEWSRSKGWRRVRAHWPEPGSPQRARCARRSPEGEAALRVPSSVSALRAPDWRGDQPAGRAQARGQARRAGGQAGLLKGLWGSAGAVDGGCGGPKVVLARRASQPTRDAKLGAENRAGTQQEDVNRTVAFNAPPSPVL